MELVTYKKERYGNNSQCVQCVDIELKLCLTFSPREGSSTDRQSALWCRAAEWPQKSRRWHQGAFSSAGRAWISSHLSCEPEAFGDNESPRGVLQDAGCPWHLRPFLLLWARIPNTRGKKLPCPCQCYRPTAPGVQYPRGWDHTTDATEAVKSFCDFGLLQISGVSTLQLS